MRAFSLLSTSKHSGALMSSRLMPPKVGSRLAMMSTSLSGSVSLISMSNTSMSANFLNRTALPSITGLAASGPMAPRPSTAVPLVMTAIRLPRLVTSAAVLGSATMSSQAAATPGRIGQGQVALAGQRLGGDDGELSGPRHGGDIRAPRPSDRRRLSCCRLPCRPLPVGIRRIIATGAANDSRRPADLGRNSSSFFRMLWLAGRVRLVRSRRLELPRVAPQRPQRCASTSSATTASEPPKGRP